MAMERIHTLAQPSKEELFWGWFISREDELFSAADMTEAQFEELGQKLSRIHSRLSFELGAPTAEQRTLILTVNGSTAAIPAVIRLINSAPALSRWRIVPFRQPQPKDLLIETLSEKGVLADISAISFKLLPEGRRIGVRILFPKATSDQYSWAELARNILVNALGELLAMTCVGTLDLDVYDPAEEGEYISYNELSPRFIQAMDDVRGQYSAVSACQRLSQAIARCARCYDQVIERRLIGHTLNCTFRFFSENHKRAEEIRAALTSLTSDAIVTHEYSALGEGYCVKGTVIRKMTAPDSLTSLVDELASKARSVDVDFDGITLSRPAKLETAQTVIVVGSQLLQEENHSAAIKIFKRALVETPKHPELIGLLGYAQTKAGAAEEARATLETLSSTLESPHTFPATRWNAACAFAILGDIERSLSYLREALRLNPSLLELARLESDLENVRSHPAFSELISN